MRNSRWAALGVGLGFCLVGAGAKASGISTARFGGEHGNPVTTNPTAIYYNPAGLAEASGFHLFLDASLAIRSARYKHERSPDVGDDRYYPEPAGAEGANTNEATLFNTLVVPMFGASAELIKGDKETGDGRLTLGAGVYVPFGGTSIWDKNERFESNAPYAGIEDGAQRWYSINGTIQSTYFSLGAGYKIPSTGLSIGVTGNLIRSVIDTVRARFADGTNNIEEEGRSYVDVSGLQYSLGVGLMWEAMKDKLWMGASYQTKPNLSGGMVLKGKLNTALLKPNGAQVDATDVRVEQDLPDIVRLGARMKLSPVWEARLFGDYTRWSALKEQCMGHEDVECEVDDAGRQVTGAVQNLPRHWQDAWAIRIGVSHWLMDKRMELMTGVGYDSNAIPDEALDPALMDFDDVSLALGARYQVIKPLFAALTYTQLFYFPRDVKNRNWKWEPPSAGPDASGHYAQFIGVVNANVEMVF